MADETGHKGIWLGIIPIVVGGLLTIAGGWMQTRYQGQQWERQHELAMYDQQLVEIDAFSDTLGRNLAAFKGTLDSLKDALNPGGDMRTVCMRRHALLGTEVGLERIFGYQYATFSIYFSQSTYRTLRTVTKEFTPLTHSLDALLHCNPIGPKQLPADDSVMNGPIALIDSMITRAEYADSYLAALRVERHLAPGAYVDSVGSRARFYRRVMAWDVTGDSNAAADTVSP